MVQWWNKHITLSTLIIKCHDEVSGVWNESVYWVVRIAIFMQWFSESAKFFMTLTKNNLLPVYVAKERCISAVFSKVRIVTASHSQDFVLRLCLKILRWIITQNVEDHNVKNYGTAEALTYCTTLNYFCSEAGTSFKTYVLLMDKCIIILLW